MGAPIRPDILGVAYRNDNTVFLCSTYILQNYKIRNKRNTIWSCILCYADGMRAIDMLHFIC